MNNIERIISKDIRNIINKDICQGKYTYTDLMEIRLRCYMPLVVCLRQREFIYEYCVTPEDIRSTIDCISEYSLYAYEEELRQGFITVKGGHRVGLMGQAITEHGGVKSMKNISFINIRVANQVKGCGMSLLPYIVADGKVLHTLIISPPGCGKTTILRDVIRLLSDGTSYIKGMSVGVVDERSEIAACYLGIPQNDVGKRTDVLDACPKAEGMLMLLRSMNPRVIAVDEIGGRQDIEAISYVINCGCGIIATAHGNSIDDIRQKPVLRKLVEQRVFDRYVILGKSSGIGTIESIFDERGNDLLICSYCAAN